MKTFSRLFALGLLACILSTTGAAGQSTGADSAGVAKAIGKYLRQHNSGRLGFDSSLTCNDGFLCVISEKGRNPAKENSRKHFAGIMTSAASASTISWDSVSECTGPEGRRSCHLKGVDFFFRIYQPVFLGQNARVAFSKEGVTSTLAGNRLYEKAGALWLSRKGGQWQVDSTAATSLY